MNTIELFAGCGGAALGLEAAGFEHLALVEVDPDACATMRAAGLQPVIEGDVRDLDRIAAVVQAQPDLIWASFPCQCWSVGGKRLGALDPRNGWPWTIDAIRRFSPDCFVGENVRGITFHSEEHCGDPMHCPGCYTEQVILEDLRSCFPCVALWHLNAADFGIPQMRRRVFFVGSQVPISPPVATHSDHGGLFTQPWVSMSEALGLDLIDSEARKGNSMVSPTVAGTESSGVGGARGRQILAQILPSLPVNATEYKGATGRSNRASDSLAMATGRRCLTIEEASKLQDFPDKYPFQGNNAAKYRQIGNAVPPKMAQVIAEAIKTGLCPISPATDPD
jgi:DNA (cytosine-5)-methyltransferase 1